MSEHNDDVELSTEDRGDDIPDFPEDGAEIEEQGTEAPKGEDQGAKDKGISIPKSRFDAAQAKARAREKELLEQLQAYKAQEQQEAQAQDLGAKQSALDELRDSYEEALIDGDREEARKFRAQIVQLEQQLLEHTVSERSNQARHATKEDLRFEKALVEVEGAYPKLNPDAEEFDPELTDEVSQVMDGLIRSGVDRVTAMQRAVKYVAGPGKTDDAASSLRDRRREEAVDKNRAAAERQPAALVGADHDTAGKGTDDVKRMSDKAFNALSEEEMARLRGDIL